MLIRKGELSPNALKVSRRIKVGNAMSERINLVNLQNAFMYYCAAASKLGFTTTDWHLSVGSRTQGNPYMVYVQDRAVTLPATIGNGTIGRTRREAYDTLQTSARTMEAVARQMGLTD
jgi:hypothetical protein